MPIDRDLMDAEFEKWKAECDRIDAALERTAAKEEGLTIEQSKAAFLDLFKRKTEAGERLLEITRALEAHRGGTA
jgi:hypothetical protein